MLHWIPSPSVAFLGARPAAALPGDGKTGGGSQRGRHALTLAYAAQRRRAAANAEDAAYWKAAEGFALEKARNLRTREGLERLP